MPSYNLTPDPIANRGDIVAGDPAERGNDKLLLGHLIESGPRRELWLDVSGEQVVSIFGKRGTGKSYTLGVILEGLSAGQGETRIASLETPRGALMFDIMDIYWTSQLELNDAGPAQLQRQYELMVRRGFASQHVNVDVWVPAGYEKPEIDPLGIHQLRISPRDLSLDDWGALFEVDIFTEPRGMLIADAIQHVSVDGYDCDDGSRVQAKQDFDLTDMLSCMENDVDLQRNYQDPTLRSIRQRFTTYASLPLFTGHGTQLQDIVQPFRSSVLMLGRVPDALKRVIVAVLLRGILRNRRDVSFAQKRLDLDASLSETDQAELQGFVQEGLPRTWILMDEAHVLVGSGPSTVASQALIKYAKEGRNYGLSLAVATQQPSALHQQLLSQVETLITHQLTSPQDAATATKAMRSPPADAVQVDGQACDMASLLRRLTQGQAVFSSGNAPSLRRSCVAEIRPRITAHGGYEA